MLPRNRNRTKTLPRCICWDMERLLWRLWCKPDISSVVCHRKHKLLSCLYVSIPDWLPDCLRVRVTRSLVSCVCFIDRCLSFCPFSFVYFVFVFRRFDLQILITPLVSSNSSYSHVSKSSSVLVEKAIIH